MTNKNFQKEMRLAVIQTSRGLSPEVDVFLSLAKNLDNKARERNYAVKILLIQGTDERYSSSNISSTARSFEAIEGLEIIPLKVGSLDRSDSTRLKKLASILVLLLQMPKLAFRLRRWRPDFIYSAQQKWDIRVAAFLARFLNIPQLLHLHYTIGSWLGAGVISLIRSSTRIICVSNFIKTQAIENGVNPSKVYTIYNSLPKKVSLEGAEYKQARKQIRDTLSLCEETKVVGMIAALSERKGQHFVIQAFAEARQNYTGKVALVLVGRVESGAEAYKVRLESMVKADNLDGLVHFLGYRRDIPELLAAFDIFIHPSNLDPFPLAVLEASSAGLPVVAWNEGGIAEAIEQGQSGLLAEKGNEEELAKHLTYLLNHPQKAADMGHNGQGRVAALFNKDRATLDFLDILESIVKA